MFLKEHFWGVAERKEYSSRNMWHLNGVIFNGMGIVVGSGIGLLGGRRLRPDFRDQAMRLIGVIVVLIGLKMAWPLPDPVNTLLSLVIGGWLGSLTQLQLRLEQFGQWAESRVKHEGFAKGFIAATLLFNVGAMAILGSLQEGLTGRYSILATKAVLDGTTALLLTTVLGWGVVVATVPTVVYEGSVVVLARNLSEVLRGALMQDVTVVGGLMIGAIGFNFLTDRALIRIGDLLPALLVAVVVGWLKLKGLSFL